MGGQLTSDGQYHHSMTASLGLAACCWSSMGTLFPGQLQTDSTTCVNTCWMLSNHSFLLQLQLFCACACSTHTHMPIQCTHKNIVYCMQEQGQHAVCSVHDKAEVQAEVDAHVLRRPRWGTLYAAPLRSYWSVLLLFECISCAPHREGQLRQSFLHRNANYRSTRVTCFQTI